MQGNKDKEYHYLGFSEIEDDSMYEDNTPIVIITDRFGDVIRELIGKEEINNYIKKHGGGGKDK